MSSFRRETELGFIADIPERDDPRGEMLRICLELQDDFGTWFVEGDLGMEAGRRLDRLLSRCDGIRSEVLRSWCVAWGASGFSHLDRALRHGHPSRNLTYGRALLDGGVHLRLEIPVGLDLSGCDLGDGEVVQLATCRHLAGDPAGAKRRLLEDNVVRRQLGLLALARCYRRLKALARRQPARPLDEWDRRALRDQLAETFGRSGRSLDRYLRVAEATPREVQDAVEAGRLPLTVAEKVAGLDAPAKGRIADAIRDGAAPAEAVRPHLAPGTAGTATRTPPAGRSSRRCGAGWPTWPGASTRSAGSRRARSPPSPRPAG